MLFSGRVSKRCGFPWWDARILWTFPFSSYFCPTPMMDADYHALNVVLFAHFSLNVTYPWGKAARSSCLLRPESFATKGSSTRGCEPHYPSCRSFRLRYLASETILDKASLASCSCFFRLVMRIEPWCGGSRLQLSRQEPLIWPVL